MTVENPISAEGVPVPGPGVLSASIPPEMLDGSPLADLTAELIQRRDEYTTALKELHALVGQEKDARQADQAAFAAATAAGKKDPGTPAHDKLVSDCAAGRRRVEALVVLVADAYKALYREFKPGRLGDEWADELRAQLDASEARLTGLLGDIEDVTAEMARPLALLDWLTNDSFKNGRSKPSGATVFVASSLDSIRSTVADARSIAENPPEPKRAPLTPEQVAARMRH